ncbi:class F sortase [Pseudonocardia sp.]|uniref:class F sortase n=1 Tax=Pseudonocardia sp. TaxID=60912 RepID=UPI003D133CDE
MLPGLLALAAVSCLVAGGTWLATDLRTGADLGSIGFGGAAGPGASGVAPTAVPGPVAPWTDPPAGNPRAGTVPVTLELPSRQVSAAVVPVVTGQDGGLIVPEPPSTVGWWTPSALPGGTGGTTVVAGHVDTRTGGIGALAVLREVEVGEPVVLSGADGRVVAYRVVARRHHPKADLPPEIFAVGGPPRLVLITCGGTFDPVTRHYGDNVVVYAEPDAPGPP